MARKKVTQDLDGDFLSAELAVSIMDKTDFHPLMLLE